MRATHFVHALERVAGIEPARSAWKAGVLPLNYTRETSRVTREYFLPATPTISATLYQKHKKQRADDILKPGNFSQQVSGYLQSTVYCFTCCCTAFRTAFSTTFRPMSGKATYGQEHGQAKPPLSVPAKRANCRLKLVEGGGFEPPKLSRQIYSLIPLAAREPLQQSIRRFYYPWHFYTGAAF